MQVKQTEVVKLLGLRPPRVGADQPAAGPLHDLAAGIWRRPDLAEDRARLLSFARDSGLVIDIFDYGGAFLAATRLDLAGTGETITANGTHFEPARALLSCIAEAVEIQSWVFRDADRQRLQGSPPPGSAPQLNAARVLGFAESPLADNLSGTSVPDGWDSPPPADALAAPRDWLEVSAFDGARRAFCPAFLCFGRFGRLALGRPEIEADSNGCAAGPDVSAARGKAMLELCERDAAGLWWWRGCVRPRLAVDNFENPALLAARRDHRALTGRQCWFLDISALRTARSVVAISCDRRGAAVALGFGTAFDVADAAQSAFHEMLQTELSILAHGFRAAQQAGAPPAPADRRMARWLAEARLDRLPFLQGSAPEPVTAPSGTAERLAAELQSIGSAVWFADLQRQETGIAVTKAIAEGLCHYKPRLGAARLWHEPEAQGWPTTIARDQALRHLPLLV